MAALLTLEKDNTDKVVRYVDEVKRLGLELFPPDINKSDLVFSAKKIDDKEVWEKFSNEHVGVSLRLPIRVGQEWISEAGGGGSRVDSSNDGSLSINDGEKAEGVTTDKDTAELADLVGRVANEADERATQISVDARGITVGQSGRAGGQCADSGDGAGGDSASEVIEVPCEGEVVSLIGRARNVRALGVEVGVVVGGRGMHAAKTVQEQ